MIDYDKFSILFNAYEFGGLTEDDLIALNIIDRTTLDAIAITDGFWSELLASRKGRLGARRYSSDFDYIYVNYYGDIAIDSFYIDFDIREYRGKNQIRKRSAGWHYNGLAVKLGNYLAYEASGLTIGRYDYRPSSGLSSDDNFDFISPLNSYYNGLKLGYEANYFQTNLYYSYKEYNDAVKTFIGSSNGVTIGKLKTNCMAGYNILEINSNYDKRLALGVSVKYQGDDYFLSGEYTTIEKNDGFYLESEKTLASWRIRTEFWRYDKNFYSYNCSGPAAADYESYHPLDNSLGFRSSQAGETGMSLNYYIGNLAAGLQFWENSDDDHLNQSSYIRYRHSVLFNLDCFFQLSYKYSNDTKTIWSKAFIDCDIWIIDKVGTKTYFTETKLKNGNSYVYTNLYYDMSARHALKCTIRYYLDNNIYWQISESVRAMHDINLRGEVSHKNYTRVNLKIEKVL